MMLVLILAQLVLPWPGLDSPRVQPGPTICVGECAGPVVWGPAERGRLVVACDMTSDTCSDGRKITTQRATPVPCETSPGVWEMVPENTGCYSVRGLESWAANTSYLSWGAELDRSPWGPIRGGTLERVSDGWRVSNDPAQANSGWYYMGGEADEGVTYTVACRVRAETPTTLRVVPLDIDSGCPLHQVGTEWATVSCTQIAGAGRRERAHIWPGVGQSGPASVIVAGCWLTKTSTPGRPCWGGEAPVTCAADRHTIVTEGWPTMEGEISWTIRIERLPKSGDPVRGIFGVDAPYSHRLGLTGAGSIFLRPADGTDAFSPSLEWEVGRTYSMRLVFTPAGWKLYRDGSVVWSVTRTTAFDWGAVARVGHNLDGSISNLRIRSTP